jgi:hypothetical protein
VASSDLRLIKELSFVNFLSLPDGEWCFEDLECSVAESLAGEDFVDKPLADEVSSIRGDKRSPIIIIPILSGKWWRCYWWLLDYYVGQWKLNKKYPDILLAKKTNQQLSKITIVAVQNCISMRKNMAYPNSGGTWIVHSILISGILVLMMWTLSGLFVYAK